MWIWVDTYTCTFTYTCTYKYTYTYTYTYTHIRAYTPAHVHTYAHIRDISASRQHMYHSVCVLWVTNGSCECASPSTSTHSFPFGCRRDFLNINAYAYSHMDEISVIHKHTHHAHRTIEFVFECSNLSAHIFLVHLQFFRREVELRRREMLEPCERDVFAERYIKETVSRCTKNLGKQPGLIAKHRAWSRYTRTRTYTHAHKHRISKHSPHTCHAHKQGLHKHAHVSTRTLTAQAVYNLLHVLPAAALWEVVWGRHSLEPVPLPSLCWLCWDWFSSPVVRLLEFKSVY